MCAGNRGDQGAGQIAAGYGSRAQAHRAIHGVRYELPPGDEIWQVARDGEARTASGVEAEIVSFPLTATAKAQACRDHERERLKDGNASVDTLRDQELGDDGEASWAFTSGTGSSGRT